MGPRGRRAHRARTKTKKSLKERAASETNNTMAGIVRFRPVIVAAMLTGGIAYGWAGSAAYADCPAAVAVRGSEPARTRIAAELVRVGLDLAPRPGCAADDVVVA